jgi:hypothetical protein
MAIKNYKITFPDLYWNCEISIDEEFTTSLSRQGELVTTKDLIKEMVEFWCGWEEELENNDGDYTKTFLQKLARKCLYIIVSNGYNLYGVVSEFTNIEGWYNMDGRYGIWIKKVDSVELESNEFKVLEMKKTQQ